jgi:hypothetical protein
MKEEDIIARQSRPQRHSTWIPKTRDWRYASGVFQHDDFEDVPKDRSAWDKLDWDYQNGNQVEEVNNTRSMSRSGTKSSGDNGEGQITPTPNAPVSAESSIPSKTIVRVEAVTRKSRSARKNTWRSLVTYTSKHEAAQSDEPHYDTVSLTVKLKFSGKLIIQEPSSHPTPSPLAHTHTDPKHI